MRTLMLIASVAMIGSGIFCIANGSAAFLTVAFIIGLVFCVMGLLEMFIGFRADFDVTENAVSITKDGLLMLVFGIVVLSAQVTSDTTAQMLFAMWLSVEGVLAFNAQKIDFMNISASERINVAFSVIMLCFGAYMFFNLSLFNFPVTLLIGISLIIIGLRRFTKSFEIEYNRPSFITGNEEKLKDALEEEKRALAKAKEGIREQKNAQRRIQKIREDMAAEQDVLSSAAMRRQEREQEKALEKDSE
ncbi:MAG: DUF308 domain-containing protein [Mogibacterium sp.]|nr:DUF308 domain-containing protein [Mogibacterium sp.]